MPKPTRLYKGGQVSGPIYGPVDVAAWIADGWSLDPQEKAVFVYERKGPGLPEIEWKEDFTGAAKNPILQDLPFVESPSPRQARESELLALYLGESGDQANWRPVKKIADQHGIEKPQDGWDEAIPMILDAEYPKD